MMSTAVYTRTPTIEPHKAQDQRLMSENSNGFNELLRHPLGVRPSGNALTCDQNLQDAMGSWNRLPDATILLLLEWLDAKSLADLGNTCRAFFAYSTYDQLWRDLALVDLPSDFDWRGSWRASLRKLSSPRLPIVDCRNLFSDALHRPFVCSQINLTPYTSDIPHSNAIPRLRYLSSADFDASWSNRPFLLTEPVKKWKVFDQWRQDVLLDLHGKTVFRAESVDWPLNAYVEYMKNTNDESPLYLFDRSFAEKMNLEVGEAGDYVTPNCFKEDLFTVLGEQRPDHRWLIIGPERSGSTFHKDPNSTSAWNAVVRGSKYWIMFPAFSIPPGVHMSEDQSEVTSPLSIAEWLLTFHEEARRTPGCLEGVCGEGEVVHVPSGWWHLVVNLEPAIAITQNFVPRSHLDSVIRFLRDKVDQVSGFKAGVDNPFELFRARLKDSYPEIVIDEDPANSKKRKWEDVVGKEEDVEVGGGFSFGFGDDLDDEV